MGANYRLRLAKQARALFEQGYHWSEAVLLTVSEHLYGELDRTTIRMATAMAGGIGDTHQEVCGALSAGALAIGGLYGRTQLNEDNRRCLELTSRWYDYFRENFGSTHCQDLLTRATKSKQGNLCSSIVEQSVHLLLQLIVESRWSQYHEILPSYTKSESLAVEYIQKHVREW